MSWLNLGQIMFKWLIWNVWSTTSPLICSISFNVPFHQLKEEQKIVLCLINALSFRSLPISTQRFGDFYLVGRHLIVLCDCDRKLLLFKSWFELMTPKLWKFVFLIINQHCAELIGKSNESCGKSHLKPLLEPFQHVKLLDLFDFDDVPLH